MQAAPTVPTDQSAVIAFLSDPASYGLRRDTVEQIGTHCSIVFLAGDCAYKLKRAIRYASLDYTTSALRQAACEAELRLNRRTAPELYLETRAINRDASGRLSFNGSGPAIDRVVVMRRFAPTDLFDRLAEADRLTPDIMRSLGATVARFHLAAEPTPGHGGAEAIRDAIADNDRELAKVAPALDGAAVGILRLHSHAALDDLAPLLEQRRADGKVTRCHGDLRLPNICLFHGRPTLFDCVEFSDAIGCIDVLYDLAFLLMDLNLLCRNDLANAVFNAWLDVAPETTGLRTLPLFLSLRAATRAYALAGAARRRSDPRQVTRLLTSARHHIDAAIDFLTHQPPVLVALGSGDDDVEELAALLAAICPPAPGARVLHATEPLTAACDEASTVLMAGCSVVLHSDFSSRAAQRAVAELASGLGVDWRGLWFGPPPTRLDAAHWQALDSSQGTLCALAEALPLVPANPLAM